MNDLIKTDICIIGAGSGGLSLAAGASMMGARTVLIERHKMGGDCLNYGCVPSKALIAASRAAENIRQASAFGIRNLEPTVDFLAVHDHIKEIISNISPNDSVERFEGLGVRVILEQASFLDTQTVIAGNHHIQARRFVIATGSSPLIPPIPGLDEVTYLTNETIFDIKERPKHLIVVGGGVIGVELAQAHRRLGAKVTVVEMSKVLGDNDIEGIALVRKQLLEDGITIYEDTVAKSVEKINESVRLVAEVGGSQIAIEGSHLLVSVGRRTNVEDLNLEAAGIKSTLKGIQVDARLRTTNRKVFAMGDAASPYQFTHVAGYHAGIIIRNILFKLPVKAKYDTVPQVIFTDPEFAHVGLTEKQSEEKFGEHFKILRCPFSENDRAQTERKLVGMIKVITSRRGRILGATIVGAHAGELILPWVLAIKCRKKIGAMADLIAPYPTLSEVSKKIAGTYFAPTLFGENTKRLVRFLQNF